MEVHRRGILHLDIKEANILITHDEKNKNRFETASLPISFVLADFGVSKVMTDAVKKNELVTYHRGTPKYMAPEQAVLKPVQDVYKVEVFQLGVVLFRLIYKAYPFTPSVQEDSNARNPNFLEEFECSARNTSKVRASSGL